MAWRIEGFIRLDWMIAKILDKHRVGPAEL
jgi:hypothetical protein